MAFIRVRFKGPLGGTESPGLREKILIGLHDRTQSPGVDSLVMFNRQYTQI